MIRLAIHLASLAFGAVIGTNGSWLHLWLYSGVLMVVWLTGTGPVWPEEEHGEGPKLPEANGSVVSWSHVVPSERPRAVEAPPS